MEEYRLQKYLADCGVASRRKSEILIIEGRVTVNGTVVTELGTKVTIKDRVTVNDKVVRPQGKKIYIMLNKPAGYVSTVSDEFDRPTVMDLLEGIKERVYPVGRLDYDTSGLLLMTNDGDFTFKLTHPSHKMTKTYVAEVIGKPSDEALDSLRKGIELEGHVTSPAKVKVLEQKEDSTVLEVIIHEGKNRQVRNMFDAIEHPTMRLKRTAVGKLNLGDLQKGKWKYINPASV